VSGHPEVVESTTPFDTGFLKVVVDKLRFPDGSQSEYQTVKHPGAVAVVPVDENGRILLVRQRRHAVDDNLLEIPAGKLEPDEDPWDCARRELEEETGFTCGHLELLVNYFTSPGFTDERVQVFLGKELRKVAEPPETDSSEPISIEWLDKQEAVPAILDGRVVDGKSIVGLALLRLQDHPEDAGKVEI
jgi:ADP-ribose pyrophosphatase